MSIIYDFTYINIMQSVASRIIHVSTQTCSPRGALATSLRPSLANMAATAALPKGSPHDEVQELHVRSCLEYLSNKANILINVYFTL